VVEPATRPLEWDPPRQAISRVPYLPGLDGMRGIAVAAVIVYHANSAWLPGGFLGVEVFFVISGYLITLLLIGEHERTGRVSLRDFYVRRARRLLPALLTLLVAITVYTTLFRRDALGQLRGDVIAALTYVSNWYQIWVGQGYTASGDFAPLRHLWSLAVEEQFYVLWPLAMLGLLRLGRRRLPELSQYLVLAAVLVSVAVALLYYPGPIESCDTTPDAYWNVAGRCISKVDTLYLSTPTRATGLLLGAAFAMVWRPVAIRRSAVRNKGGMLDIAAVVGLVGLGALCWFLHIVTSDGADPWLFRGGFFVTGVASLLVIAAVTHQGSRAGAVLGVAPLLWIGTRSYGLYLYHWPIFQIMRRVAGRPLSVTQFVVGILLAAAVTEVSYRYIETPIRRGQVGRWWRNLQSSRDPAPRRLIAGAGACLVAVSVFAATNLATAQLKPNEIEQSLNEARDATQDLGDLLGSSTTDDVPSTATTVAEPGPSGAPGATTVPPAPTTVAPTTTAVPTTLPPPPPIVALGDSVMLGAADELTEAGIYVDAAVSRQMQSVIPEVEQLRDAGRLPEKMVVHLGTNGTLSDDSVNAFFTALATVPRVVVLTVRAPGKSWIDGNNAKIVALPAQFPNVSVLYWDGLAGQCQGNCFYDDGIHLRQAGQDYYTALITSQLEA
jgi:peptidoglycan/LPS O-acetylase OafA/YrhL